jgi:8-oxo-dGTP diphosphatase
VIAGTLAAADESLEARTFGPQEIPWDEIAFDSTRDALKDYINLYLNQTKKK